MSGTDGDAISVGRLALVGTEEFYESIRKSQDRAATFLRFILEYVATADPSWRQRAKILCKCGIQHTIVPCDWLAWMRRTQWVPRGKHSEHASTENLAALAKRDADLAALITREETQELLELLGINILEQTLLGVDEVRRPAMRRKLAELTKVISDPTDIDDIVKGIEVRRQVRDQWASNQALGRKVEELVRDVLEKMKVDVEIHFRGYDLEAYFGAFANENEDVGLLEVGFAKIEIKATRSGTVSMSDVQARDATADTTRYWLCVVALDPLQSVAALDSHYVRERARFVPGIGEILSQPCAELTEAVDAAEVAGVELQYVDKIRYRVPQSIWEKHGVSAWDFVQRVVAQIQAP